VSSNGSSIASGRRQAPGAGLRRPGRTCSIIRSSRALWSTVATLRPAARSRRACRRRSAWPGWAAGGWSYVRTRRSTGRRSCTTSLVSRRRQVRSPTTSSWRASTLTTGRCDGRDGRGSLHQPCPGAPPWPPGPREGPLAVRLRSPRGCPTGAPAIRAGTCRADTASHSGAAGTASRRIVAHS
jgi:hypothetical protein